jgi:outer membrane protein TolC
VVNVPLYDSGATQARVKAARQDEEQNRLQDEQLRLAIQLDVRQALTRLQSAQEQLVATKKTVELATEALRIARVRYDAGEAIQLEVSSAERALTEARTSEASARYDYLVAYAALQRAVGTDDLPVARAASQEVKN